MSKKVDLDEELLKLTEKKPKPKKKKTTKDDEKFSDLESPDEKQKSPSSDSEGEYSDQWGEDLMGDANERKRLLSLPMIERESIIYERHEKRKELKEKKELKRKMKEERGTKNSSKRESAMSELQAEKKRKDERRKRKERSSPKRAEEDVRRSPISDNEEEPRHADRREDLDDEKERKQKKPASWTSSEKQDTGTSSPNREQEATLEDLNSVRLTRLQLEKWVGELFFDKELPGFYVKIMIGLHEGKKVYRMCPIKAVVQGGKKYPFGKKETQKTLLLDYAGSSKQFRMEFISNSNFLDAEYIKWKNEMKKNSCPLPTKDEIEQLKKRLAGLSNYHYSPEEIEKIIEEKQKNSRKPFNFGKEKARLTYLKETALENGEHDLYQKYSDELAKIEEKSKQMFQENKYVVMLNKKQSEVKEIKEPQMILTPIPQVKKVEKETNVIDPFSRRPTKPTIMWHTGVQKVEKEEEGDGKPKKEEKKDEKEKEKLKREKEVENIPLTSSLELIAESLEKAHNLVNIDLSVPSPAPVTKKIQPPPVSPSPSTGTTTDKKLSVEDYKRRRGLID